MHICSYIFKYAIVCFMYKYMTLLCIYAAIYLNMQVCVGVMYKYMTLLCVYETIYANMQMQICK